MLPGKSIALLVFALFCAAWQWPEAQAQIALERAFLLVSTPGMQDPNFSETVVLVVREGEGGPLGVILNRPTTAELRAVYPDRAELAQRNDLLFLGGPVQPEALLFAFRSAVAPERGLHVIDDIYLSGYSEVLNQLLRHPEQAAEQRFFTGYAGWAEGQLESEIARSGWYVLPLDVTAIFERNPLDLYRQFLERATVRRIEAHAILPAY